MTIEGEDKAIFKNPKTDSGLKRSLKGRIAVVQHDDGFIEAFDDATPKYREQAILAGRDLLQTVWKDGEFVKYLGFDEVRKNTGLVE